MPVDHYSLLGVDPTSPAGEIEKAVAARYRQAQVQANSPNADRQHQAERMMVELMEAKRILLDPMRRAQYDNERAADARAATARAAAAMEEARAAAARAAWEAELRARQGGGTGPPPPDDFRTRRQPVPPPPPIRVQSSGAGKALLFSTIGGMACGIGFPVGWGLAVGARRRIKASGGSLSGAGTAALALVLGVAGTLFELALLAALIVMSVNANVIRPKHPNDAEILALVKPALVSCGNAATINPANCPQSASVYDPKAIVWTLHGDPTAGATVTYKLRKNYQVLGVAVYALTTGQANKVKVVAATYRTIVHWSASPTMDAITSTSDTVNVPRPSAMADAAVQASVRAAFAACAAAQTVVAPPACPADTSSGGHWVNIRWRLAADPLLNSRVTYDAQSGLAHVVGSYVMTLSYDDLDLHEARSRSFTGNYDALVADDGGQLATVMIQAAS